jgi:eukaryotic-like serine/threonine-protein kinase
LVSRRKRFPSEATCQRCLLLDSQPERGDITQEYPVARHHPPAIIDDDLALIPGTRVGPYEVTAQIGVGGMGEVYRATDTNLAREVAIKVLPEAFAQDANRLERFEREAKTLASLNHPNIAQIHGLEKSGGMTALVMELVEGDDLSQRLVRGAIPIDEALPLATQIAEALEAAHEQGIVHRDLKPANVLMTRKGVAKLADFGLATLVAHTEVDHTRTVDTAIVGTPAYMSPEQADGTPLDARTDIFGFGAVLYELLSGRPAFEGDTVARVLSAVLRDDPRPLPVSAALDRLVRRCLAKQPAQRFQKIAEVKAALEQLSARSAGQPPSIAVLPFANMSADRENEYFSDGLTEEIINALAHIPGLKVIARTSSFAFRRKEQDVRVIAEVLGVGHVLEGSVRKAGNRIRVTAQLIAAADGSHMWSERYDRELADVFAIQDEIAEAITAALQIRLTAAGAASRIHRPTLPAYEAFLKGRHFLFLGTPENLARARDHFEEAIALDPDFADPHAELGSQSMVLGLWGVRAATEAMPLAMAEARKALALMPAEPRAHSVLGVVAALFEWDWAAADAHFRVAMAANPIPLEVRMRHGLVLFASGRTQQAVDSMAQVLELDPLSVIWRSIIALFLNGAGAYARAAAEARKALEIREDNWLAHFELAQSLAAQGLLEDAKRAAGRAHDLAPWNPGTAGLLAATCARTDHQDQADVLLVGMQPVGVVIYHALCSEFDASADWFKIVLDRRDAIGTLLAAMSCWAPLRAGPRWPKLATMMNLRAAK